MGATLATLAASVPLEFLLGSTSAGALGLAAGLAAGAGPVVLGITDLLGGSDDDEDADEDDAVFDDGDDLGDFDDGGDDLDDFDGSGDDGLDGFDDDGLDGLDDDSDSLGGGEDTNELKNRLDELENEVADLSSTVNTVQSENEVVSETVQDIEEKVRDLLEIYEMVTRGVNPFVDDTVSGATGGDAGGDFGLFDDDGGNEDADVDDSIADADAEEFFDDDFDEPGGDELADPDDAAVLDDDGGMGDALNDDVAMDDAFDDDVTMDDAFDGGDETSGDDGKSFGELKQEYESGDPGWDVDDPIEEDEGEEVGASDDLGSGDGSDELVSGDGVDDGTADAHGFGDDVESPGGDDEPDEEAFDDEGEQNDDAQEGGSDDGDGEFEFVGERGADARTGGDDVEIDGDGRLHLREFPDGYRADLTALEWLEYLIDVGGTDGARDALSYYVDVGWISPTVEDVLHAFLDGIRVSGEDGGRPEPGGLSQFDPEDHRRSLGYVARLAGDGDRAAVLDRLDEAPAAGSVESPEVMAKAVPNNGSSELDPTDGQDLTGGGDDGI